MKKLNEKELREIDYLLAKNVMKWKLINYESDEEVVIEKSIDYYDSDASSDDDYSWEGWKEDSEAYIWSPTFKINQVRYLLRELKIDLTMTMLHSGEISITLSKDGKSNTLSINNQTHDYDEEVLTCLIILDLYGVKSLDSLG